MDQFLKNKMAAIYSIMVDVLVISHFLVEIHLAPYFVSKYDTSAKKMKINRLSYLYFMVNRQILIKHNGCHRLNSDIFHILGS